MTLEERWERLIASDPQAMAGSFELFAELREAAPVHEFETMVLVTRHEDVKPLIGDGVRYSNASRRLGSWAERNRARLPESSRPAFDDVTAFEAMYVSRTDGDVHTRLRRIAHRAFTPRRIAELEARTREYVDAMLTELAHEERPDLMDLAYRLPLMLIADLLGVPQEDRELIHDWSSKVGRNRGGVEDGPLLEAHAAMGEFRAYVDRMLVEHRRAPDPGDLVSALVGAEQDERLGSDELAAMFVVLLFAGHETTTNLIGVGMRALLEQPDQWRALCADPSLAGGATEELLRYVTPVQFGNRLPLVDVEIAGHAVPAGKTVIPLHGAANRDPRVFEDPDTIDITRANAGQHVALGFGPHFCLGASLARLEGRIVFEQLATRFPGLELAGGEPEWVGNASLRRLRELRVRPSAVACS
jgi:cytochrome P450